MIVMQLTFVPFQLVGNVELTQLARRPMDKSFVLRNYASENHGAKHIYKLNANSDKEAVYVHRQTENGQNGFEKIWRRRCPRCELAGKHRPSPSALLKSNIENAIKLY